MPRFDSLRRLPLLRGLAVFWLWACSSLTAVANEPPATIDCDLLLRQGLVCEGSLAEPKVGDVALLKGKIVAVGPGRILDNGERSKPLVKKGDTVVYGKYAGTEIEIKNVKHVIIRESELLGVIES